jgi:hypothetical protein
LRTTVFMAARHHGRAVPSRDDVADVRNMPVMGWREH